MNTLKHYGTGYLETEALLSSLHENYVAIEYHVNRLSPTERERLHRALIRLSRYTES